MSAESTTLAVEIQMLLNNASRPDGVWKKRTYGSMDKCPSGRTLRANVNTFG